MELASTPNRIVFPRGERTEELSLDLISELLAAILTDQDEELLVHARSRSFRYDPQSSIKRNATLKVTVEENTIVEKESEIEINLSGTVENRLGEKENCALYFVMWWDHTMVSPMRDSYRKTLKDAALSIDTGKSPRSLSDSVFELDLHRKGPFSRQEFLGQGRGYLLFGRET